MENYLDSYLAMDKQKLRLSGESYGIVDLQPFKDEISDNNNWSRLGFTFSVTLKTDLHPFSDRTIFFIGNYSSDGTSPKVLKLDWKTLYGLTLTEISRKQFLQATTECY